MKKYLLIILLIIIVVSVHATELQFPKTDFDSLTIGGGYDSGGISFNNGSGFFGNNLIIRGNFTTINTTNSTSTRTSNLLKQDGTNFFTGSGSASQTLTSIGQTGVLSFTSISITESQISNLQSYLLATSSFFSPFWNRVNQTNQENAYWNALNNSKDLQNSTDFSINNANITKLNVTTNFSVDAGTFFVDAINNKVMSINLNVTAGNISIVTNNVICMNSNCSVYQYVNSSNCWILINLVSLTNQTSC